MFCTNFQLSIINIRNVMVGHVHLRNVRGLDSEW